MSRSPHDELFRHTFQQVEHAAGLFQSILPPEVVAALDWPTLQLQSGSHVDKRLRRQQSDLLFQVSMGGSNVFLYLLTEHKARRERWALLQLLAYEVAIWQAGLAARPRPRELPLILPILLHHGREPWTGPWQFTDVLAGGNLPEPLRTSLLALQPGYRPLVVSLCKWKPERIRGLAMTLFGKMVLEALQRLPGATLAQVLATVRSWRDLIAELRQAPTAAAGLSALWTYVLDAAPGRPEPVIAAIDEVMEAETTMKRMTAGAILRAEGRAEGKAEGRAEGKAEGKAEGLLQAHAHLLVKLLVERFGRVPATYQKRIRAAAIDQLEVWAMRTISAPSLAAVFGDR